MRPTKLVISAFGPYANKEILELDKLGDNGLYLITGTTGAGKTSIFDAITYALYDSPSGDMRKDSMLRSKYADDSTETYVELEFLCRDKLYTVKRNPTYTRRKTRGEGSTTQPASAELHLPGGSIIYKSTNVTKAITEIIGIDRDQFLSIAMIAQGDFRKVLLAKTEERQKIFRQIFKTERFEKIQNRIKDETNALYRELNNAKQNLATHISGIEYGNATEQTEWQEKIKAGQCTTQEITDLLTSLLESDQKTNDSIATRLVEIEIALEKVNASIGKAEEYAKNLEEYNNKKTSLPDIEKEYSDAKVILEEAKAKKSEIEKNEKEVTLIDKEIPDYDALESLQNEVMGLEKSLIQDEKSLKSANDNIDQTTQKIKKLKEALKSLENASLNKEKLEGAKKRSEERKTELNKLSNKLDTLQTMESALAVMQNEYRALADDAQALTDKYNNLHRRFLDGQAGIMASSLTDGAPCPVCGSLSHPNLAKTSAEVPTEDEVQQAQKAAQKANKTAEEKSRDCSTLDGSLKESEKNIQLRIEELLGKVTIQEATAIIKDKIDEVDRELAELATQIKVEEANVAQKTEIERSLPDEETDLEALTKRVGELGKTIAANAETKKQKSEQIAKLIKNLKFASKADAVNALRTLQNSIQSLKKAIDDAEHDFKAKETELTTLNTEIATLKKVVSEVCKIDLGAEKTAKNELLEEKRALQSSKETIVARIKSNKSCLDKIVKTEEERQAIEEHYRWMNSLSNTANGDISSKERISFETFVQMSYFERILSRSNIRLQKMTGGQYDLIRRVDELGRRTQVGLDIDVLDHHNGSTRQVDSLSGGEQFKASLALALGLSDEIQSSAGGVRLDTMFVDEGFGSLDGESLQLAIATLQDLTEGNRLVGIISHVEELKNKIDKQIVVEKQKSTASGSKAHIVNP